MSADSKTIREGILKAREIARAISDGSIDPHDGANQIAAITDKIDHPRFLLEMYHLAHLQQGHEKYGFHKEQLKEDIIKAAKTINSKQHNNAL